MANHYTMHQYLAILNKHNLVIDKSIEDTMHEVTHVSCNSKEVVPGTIFICKGIHFKEEYLHEAITLGAICYISEVKYDINAPCIIVKDVRVSMSYLSDLYYQSAWQRLKLVGITGTKGKSTTSYFVKYILDTYLKALDKKQSGIISTIHTFDGDKEYESHITTPESIDLHKLFKTAVDNEIKYMTMEVSSQALKYHRVLGVTFDIGVFLNIGYDHISEFEHPNFEDYLNSKLKLFEQSKVGILNLNTDYLEKVLEASKHCPNVYTFGVDTPEADVYGYNIRKQGREIVFTTKTKSYTKDFIIGIAGSFNVDNALAAIAICEQLEVPVEYIYEGLKNARVSGRMEVYESIDQRVVCIVDYAHNGLSFEKLFESVQEEYPDHHRTIVFGCPGDKAFERRKDLGEIAGKYADTIYLTEDDPGEEEIIDICQEIGGHITGQGNTFTIILDREKAIEKAVMECTDKTVILIAGKGNDNTQRRGRQYVEMPTDADYALKILDKYNEK